MKKLLIRLLVTCLTGAALFTGAIPSSAVDRQEKTVSFDRHVHYSQTLSDDTKSKKQWYFEVMQVENAWDVVKVYRKQKVKVAVIDSGCSKSGDMKKNVNYKRYRNFGSKKKKSDVDGHGTAVCSVLGATANNKKKIAGIASGWNNNIMEIIPLSFESIDEKGNSISYLSDATAAIYHAVDVEKCQIINLSFHLEAYEKGFCDAVKYALKKGVIVVASAGNDVEGNRILYPGKIKGVITVVSTDDGNERCDYSSYGKKAFISAPAGYGDIYYLNRKGKVKKADGTSFSAAFVTGTVAMMLSVNPDLTSKAVRKILAKTASDIYRKGWDKQSGYGIVNTWKAVQMAAGDHSRNKMFENWQCWQHPLPGWQYDIAYFSNRVSSKCVNRFRCRGRNISIYETLPERRECYAVPGRSDFRLSLLWRI